MGERAGLFIALVLSETLNSGLLNLFIRSLVRRHPFHVPQLVDGFQRNFPQIFIM